MPLIPCPACGREVSAAATACPQCGQPVAGVVTPPPITVRAPLPDISIPQQARANARRSWWREIPVPVVVMVAFGLLVVVTNIVTAPQQAEEDAMRQRIGAQILAAGRSKGLADIAWDHSTMLMVIDRGRDDPQALADATCNALRRLGLRGSASVAVVERNAWLNGRREVMGKATCSLPR
jgi:hypothetical protein